MENKEQEMFDLFLVEANDHIETVERELLFLEKETDGIKKESIDNLFRAIHSIKGSSGFMQLDNINDLSHVMETLLQKMRTGEIKPESKYIDCLLNGVDLLSTMIGDIEQSESVDIDQVKNEIVHLTQTTDGPKNTKHIRNTDNKTSQKTDNKNVKTTQTTDKEQSNRLSVTENRLYAISQTYGLNITETVIQNTPPDHDLYILKFNMYETNKMPSQLVTKLQKMGQIIDANIETQADIFSKDITQDPLFLTFYMEAY
ncbi:MAG: chemotaxis protein histidine kinase-like kinase [Candidatus Magnetoglobus multicellularis str. Araruama]|uniref:Chemotaxis protein histidine kinase-like kinase n=1 Tax=Candidatus Magnetoglobus multicellularis str. Araruama TaxID=890399 RepID=A0A1V1PCZ2_9BACT|nr:MAG: chemotaxis protein histidine kinase-like kinase [Candidatus Magnetoglobus multicellularis str. Araruama]